MKTFKQFLTEQHNETYCVLLIDFNYSFADDVEPGSISQSFEYYVFERLADINATSLNDAIIKHGNRITKYKMFAKDQPLVVKNCLTYNIDTIHHHATVEENYAHMIISPQSPIYAEVKSLPFEKVVRNTPLENYCRNTTHLDTYPVIYDPVKEKAKEHIALNDNEVEGIEGIFD